MRMRNYRDGTKCLLLPLALLCLAAVSDVTSFPIRPHRGIATSQEAAQPTLAIPSWSTRSSTSLQASSNDNNNSNNNVPWHAAITERPVRSAQFSLLMTLSGAILGPFLDAYHSAFHVLQYDNPIIFQLWSTSPEFPALTTAWWVPELFGLAGFLIGWLYIVLDHILEDKTDAALHPSGPKIMVGIAIFTFQYWLSGILFYSGEYDRTTILNVMSAIAAVGFWRLDNTRSGFVTSAATGLGGPLIEVALITLLQQYHYTDAGETGFFPLWILPVYFLGGPANGNLARGFWDYLGAKTIEKKKEEPCQVCNDTRRAECPNCDGVGTYVAMGGRSVQCSSCRGRGYVMCRSCFDRYDEDPYDIAIIRDVMSRMPD